MLLPKPDNRAAAVTMLGKMVELCMRQLQGLDAAVRPVWGLGFRV